MSTSPNRIFLVDDHALVREWLANLLRQEADFEVSGQADNAPAALSAMIAQPPQIAIVDLSLKSGSGLDLIKDLRAQCPTTQVIVLTMHEEIYFVERAFRAGARSYVTKRDSPHRIVEAIRTVLSGKIYANADLLAQLTERMVSFAPGKQGGVDSLSDRELEVFRRLGLGQSTRLIATEMNLNMKTVQAYSARIKEKLGLANASELIREAVRWVQASSAD